MIFKFIIKRHDDPPSAPPLEERVLHEQIITIGSDPSATVRFVSPSVAPEQALIVVEEAVPLLINRAPGTLLNGEALAREIRRPLAHGDRLGIGDRQIIVDLDTHPNNPASEEEMTNLPAHTIEPRSFAAILNDLRTEEDSYYFRVRTDANEETRLVIDEAETLVGWDAPGEQLVADPARIAVERMIVRKDWTGVVVAARGDAGALVVNDSVAHDPRRLRDGDRVTLSAASENHASERRAGSASLVFHEPASLMALETLLPQKLPPPVARTSAGDAVTSAPAQFASTGVPAPASNVRRFAGFQKPYFGYFTSAELLIMAVATITAAVIIFLVLEYSQTRGA